jgi:hypothetical protein
MPEHLSYLYPYLLIVIVTEDSKPCDSSSRAVSGMNSYAATPSWMPALVRYQKATL